MYLKTQGLVLRVTEYRDSDAMLTVLTKEQGLMSFKARGVRSRRSQLKSACQLLCFSEFTLLERQGYYTVSEAVCLEMFQPMRNDIELLALCSYFAQAAELLSQQDVNDGEVLSLTLNSIYALCKLKRPQMLVKAAFELRMMVIAGFSPMVDGCAVCGSETPDRFDVAGGMAVCAGCSAPGSLRLPLSPASLAAMQHITTCEAKRLFSFNLLPEALKELSDIAETYFLTQLERGFYTLDFYKSLRLTGQESMNSLHHVTLVARRQQEHEMQAETRMDFAPVCPEQMAGFTYCYDSMNFYLLGKTCAEDGNPVLELLKSDTGVVEDVCDPVPVPDGTLDFKLTPPPDGGMAQFYYRQPQGEWQSIGPACPTDILTDEHCRGFTGAHVGVYAHDMAGLHNHADFDYLNVHFER